MRGGRVCMCAETTRAAPAHKLSEMRYLCSREMGVRRRAKHAIGWAVVTQAMKSTTV